MIRNYLAAGLVLGGLVFGGLSVLSERETPPPEGDDDDNTCTPSPTDDDDFTEPDLPAICADALNLLAQHGPWIRGSTSIEIGYGSGGSPVYGCVDGECPLWDASGSAYPRSCALRGDGRSLTLAPAPGGFRVHDDGGRWRAWLSLDGAEAVEYQGR